RWPLPIRFAPAQWPQTCFSDLPWPCLLSTATRHAAFARPLLASHDTVRPLRPGFRVSRADCLVLEEYLQRASGFRGYRQDDSRVRGAALCSAIRLPPLQEIPAALQAWLRSGD